jgi:ADP-heptose:LPS heptosyltransferase
MAADKTGMNKPEQHKTNPQTLALEFLSEFQTSGNYLREPIEVLARLASSSENAETSKAATRAIFKSLVEMLADSFEPKAVTLYNRLFAQLIHFCRNLPQGERLSKELATFGILREEDLLARAERLRYTRRLNKSIAEKQKIKRAVVLSRVTIGADVAVTSLVIERLKKEFVNAEIVLLGGAKTSELFGGDARIRFRDIQYQRAGELAARLSSWLDVLGCVRQLTDGLSADEYIIADPDSRLTQLGLLPLVAENFPRQQNSGEQTQTASFQDDNGQSEKAPLIDNYLFFPSRELGSRTKHSISELTTVWLDAVFGVEKKALPHLTLKSADKEFANLLVRRMRRKDNRPVVAINFGVGENPLKRLSDDFEKQLVNHLIQTGAKIIFDKGAGDAEIERANRILEEANRTTYQSRKIKVIEVDEANLQTLSGESVIDADVIVWQGRIGMLAALINESNLYIGYDSAGQHIAAALGVPCIDVFAGFTSPRMLERWHPTGSAKSQVIAVDTLHDEIDSAAVFKQILQYLQESLVRSP